MLTIEEYEQRRPGLILHEDHHTADEPLSAEVRYLSRAIDHET
jgi:hypothetical protein